MERTGVIAPSIFAADSLNLEKECQSVIENGAQWLHVDIMDGRFCPNIAIGYQTVHALRKKWPTLFLDCHMMVTEPEKWVETLTGCASCFTFHIEAVVPEDKLSLITKDTPLSDPIFARAVALVDQIRAAGIKAGVAVSPATPVDTVLPLVEILDYALVMTVVPGFSFQKFIPECVPKVAAILEHAATLPKEGALPLGVGVDGGVAKDTCCACGAAGATVLVAGGGVFKSTDRAAAIAELQAALKVPAAAPTHK